MPAADYLSGAAILAAMLAATLGGAWLILRRRFPSLRGAEAVTAFGLLSALAILAVHVLPAALGILGRGSVLVAAALWLAVCWRVPPGADVEAPPSPAPDEHRRLSEPLGRLACLAIGLFAATFALDQLAVPSGSVDFLNFHLPSVVGWIQSGTIWQVDNFLPMVAPGNYPNNGDVMLLAAVLPWHNDFLAHFAIWPFFVLTGVATYAGALRLGAARAAALVAGSLTLAIPVVAVAAMAASITDSVMLFGFAAGLLFLLRHHASGGTADLVLAGLGLGLALGTKWYGVSAVAIVVVVWLGARLLGRERAREAIRDGLALVGLIALAGGIWMLRNWIVSGNPVFPVKVDPLGITLFDAPPDVVREEAGFTILGYLGEWDPWWKIEGNPELGGEVVDGILLQWWHALAGPALVVVAGALLAAALLVRRVGSRLARGPVATALVMTALIALAYSITPYTAGGPEGVPLLVGADSRYVVPALVIAAAVTAWACTQVRLGTVVLGVAGIAAIVHGVWWAANGELSPAKLTGSNWASALLLAGVLWLAWWALEPWWARVRAWPGRNVAAAAGAAVLALVVGYAVQREFNDDRYLGADPAVDAVLAAGEDRRIGLAGVWTDEGIAPVLPAFGERFENTVSYVGPVEREMQQRYSSRDAFVAALEREGYELLVVGRGRPETGPSPEAEWASSAGWRPVAGSDRLVVYAPPA